MSVKRLTKLALFTALALIIHTIESFVPLPLPLPGVRLGLSNAVTLIMLFMPVSGDDKQAGGKTAPKYAAAVDVIIVLAARILLASLIAGRPIILAYSLTGGIFAVAAQLITRRFVTDRQIWFCGAAGGIFHNIGQISAAILITGTPRIAVYLPVLIISGIITGVFTGILAGLAVKKIRATSIL